ncbi:MAG: hypothetical protein JJE34_05500, partial [Alphaproteobacteria bacterium]|nr:hypothetical protein [Alphaproteobacteria bacterium]
SGEAALKAWLDTHTGILDDLPRDLILYYYPDYDVSKAVASMAAASNHTVVGTDGADRLAVDSAGATNITGGAGNDVLNGGAASSHYANLLQGGVGDDIYVINNALDHVVEAASAGTDEVQSRVDFTLGDNVENLRLQGSAVSGTGNALDNVMRGNDAANSLKGLGGDDLIYGNGGNDTIDGGTGNDRLYGDAGKDVIHGGAGDDLIYGGAGDDIIYGDAGNDLIEGGMGSDHLYGGAGADQFSYRPEHLLSAGAGVDSIGDFSSAQGDRILLAMLDADSHTAANDKFSFIGTDQFTGEAGQLRYAVASGDAYVCGDVNGDGLADFTMCVAGVTSLGSGDFSL